MFKYRKSMFLALRRCFFLFSVLFLGTFLVSGVITARANTRAMSFDENVKRVPATVRTQNEIIFPLPNGKLNIPKNDVTLIKKGAKAVVYFIPPLGNVYEVYNSAVELYDEMR